MLLYLVSLYRCFYRFFFLKAFKALRPLASKRIALGRATAVTTSNSVSAPPSQDAFKEVYTKASKVQLLPTNSRWRKATKQLATLGPASNTVEMIEKLFLAGVDVFRLNFSHGEHSEKAKVCS